MLEFWLLAGLMALVASGFVLAPVLGRAWRSSVAQARQVRKQVNVALFRERLAELDVQREAGEVAEDTLAELQLDARRDLLEDTADAPSYETDSHSSSAKPAEAGSLDSHASNDNLASPSEIAGSEQVTSDKASAASLAPYEHLRESSELSETPGARLWLLVAACLVPITTLLLYLGFAPGFAGGAIKAQALTEQAQAAIQAGDRVAAVNWLRLALAEDPEGRGAQMVQQLLEQMRERQAESSPEETAQEVSTGDVQTHEEAAGGSLAGDIITREATGQNLPDSDSQPGAIDQSALEPGARIIDVSVQAGDEVNLPESSIVFVYARAATGSAAPLAIRRLTLADLPRQIRLDETMAMIPGMGLANFDKVILVARVSSTGDVRAMPEDFEARSSVIDLTQPPKPQTLIINSQVGETNWAP